VGGQIELFAQTQLGLGIPEELKNRDLADRVAYYWRHWREDQVLVVIDDVSNYAAIKDYLPPVDARFKVLLTTRFKLGVIQTFPLRVLDPGAAVILLRKLIDDERRVDGQLEAAMSLCERLGRLPLAIELVGRYLARNQTLTLVKMQERLDDKRLAARALIKDKLDVAMTATHESLAAAFELSWEDLDNELIFAAPVRRYARQLGVSLSVFAVAPIVWQWMVDCVPGWDEEDLEAARKGLVDSHLLQVNKDRTYQFHPMVREFFDLKLQLYKRKPQGYFIRLVRKFLTVQQDPMSVKEEIQHSFQSVILTEAKRISKQPETSLIVECALVVPHLQELVKQGEETGAEEVTSSGLSCLSGLYYAMGKYSEAECFGLRNLTINENFFGVDHLSTAQSLGNLAEFYRKTGKYDEAEALFIRAITIYERENNPSIVVSLNNLALLYCTLGQYDDAKQLYNRSLSIAKQRLFAYPIYTAFSLTGLANIYEANIYESKDRYELAEKLNKESLKIREKMLGINHVETAESLHNLGYLYYLEHRYTEANPLLVRALAIRKLKLVAEHRHTQDTQLLLQLVQSLSKIATENQP
jgi:tetratricopeptide (TPR) repeat protein